MHLQVCSVLPFTEFKGEPVLLLSKGREIRVGKNKLRCCISCKQALSRAFSSSHIFVTFRLGMPNSGNIRLVLSHSQLSQRSNKLELAVLLWYCEGYQ